MSFPSCGSTWPCSAGPTGLSVTPDHYVTGSIRRPRRTDIGRCSVATSGFDGVLGEGEDTVMAFTLSYEGFESAAEGLREALTSTGNGYVCTRGAAEWEDADGVHYPGTYGHGVYNRETTILGGLPVLNEDLVNLPNWLVLKLRIEGEEAIRLADVDLLAYRHELRYPPRDGDPRAALPGSRRPGDDAAQSAVREHGRRSSWRDRVDADGRELGGPGRGRVGDRRAGD